MYSFYLPKSLSYPILDFGKSESILNLEQVEVLSLIFYCLFLMMSNSQEIKKISLSSLHINSALPLKIL